MAELQVMAQNEPASGRLTGTVLWLQVAPVVFGLSLFGIYATLRAFEGKFYSWGPYLSPFYSPLIDPQHHWWPFSPAILILAGPLGFRVTCYYYRKAYYRAFFLDPPGCGIAERSRGYCGETKFPYLLQNVHRYFFYLSFLYLFFLWRDAVRAFSFGSRFGIGVGTLVLVTNVALLTLYTLSCHSLRHLIGGRLDCFSCAAMGGVQHGIWRGVTGLNERHMLLAWTSLTSVGLADLYVRLVACGLLRDLRLL